MIYLEIIFLVVNLGSWQAGWWNCSCPFRFVGSLRHHRSHGVINRLRSGYGVGAPLSTGSHHIFITGVKVSLLTMWDHSLFWLTLVCPRGLCVVPYVLFLYTAPLESIITRHGLSCMKYADDSQLYISLNVSTQQNAIEKIENCIKDVKTWMSSNFLVLNYSKTEIIHFTSRFATPREFPSIYVGETAVEPTSQVRDLGRCFW